MAELKQGSTAVKLRTILSWTGGDMTTVESVTLVANHLESGAAFTREMTILGDATETRLGVEYQIEEGDFDEAGDYRLEFVLTFADGRTLILPPNDCSTLRVNARLATE